MCHEFNADVELTAWRIRHEHGVDATAIACLVQITNCLFDHHQKQYMVDLDPLLRTQRECIDAWLLNRQMSWSDIDAASRSLNRAAGRSGASVDQSTPFTAL